MCPVDAMEEELCTGPTGVFLVDSGGCACFLVSRLEVAPDGGASAVEVENARGVHDEGRPAEMLVDRGGVSRSFDEMITIDLVKMTMTIRLPKCTTLHLSNR